MNCILEPSDVGCDGDGTEGDSGDHRQPGLEPQGRKGNI